MIKHKLQCAELCISNRLDCSMLTGLVCCESVSIEQSSLFEMHSSAHCYLCFIILWFYQMINMSTPPKIQTWNGIARSENGSVICMTSANVKFGVKIDSRALNSLHKKTSFTSLCCRWHYPVSLPFLALISLSWCSTS